MATSEPFFAVKNLNAFYGRAQILHDVSFEMGSEPVAVIGRNGMGKTTLCLTVMGLMAQAKGSVRFEGEELLGQQPYKIAAAGIGYVPQGRRLFPSLSDRGAPPDARQPQRGQVEHRCDLGGVSASRRAPQGRRRAALRRRAANACDCEGSSPQPEAHRHGRALRGACPDDHREPRRDVREAGAGRRRPPAHRAKPRSCRLARKSAAGDGRRLHSGGDDGSRSPRGSRSAAALSRRDAHRGDPDPAEEQ